MTHERVKTHFEEIVVIAAFSHGDGTVRGGWAVQTLMRAEFQTQMMEQATVVYAYTYTQLLADRSDGKSDALGRCKYAIH